MIISRAKKGPTHSAADACPASDTTHNIATTQALSGMVSVHFTKKDDVAILHANTVVNSGCSVMDNKN